MTDPKPFTRRDLLKTSGGLVGASVAGAALGGAGRVLAQEAVPGGLLPELPGSFSTAERDRRWKRVRDAMRRAGFDGLLTPAGSGATNADSRYLTRRSGWLVFPLRGS